MFDCFEAKEKQNLIPITLIEKKQFPQWLSKQKIRIKNWLESHHFKAKVGQFCLLTAESGFLEHVYLGYDPNDIANSFGALAKQLPPHVYYLDDKECRLEHAALAWGMGAYQFTRYKKSNQTIAKLYLPKSKIQKEVNTLLKAIYHARDLINTPTEDMGPNDLALALKKLAKTYRGQFHQIVGKELLEENYPLVHAVGRASKEKPRLLELTWGDEDDPKVTLIGKGVCFDSGGLDIKPAAYMLLMKKDMAGAAHAMALGQMLMESQVPIRLKILIPAVENAVSADSYRPGDIFKSRKGLTVEIENTDAEGRLILADAITAASVDSPEIVIDFSTLTGSARIALGTDVPVFFSNHDKVTQDLIKASKTWQETIWQLPLYEPYQEQLASDIADTKNCSSGPFGGAITAALFLQKFISKKIPWVHFDFMAWNLSSKPAHPKGAEVMGVLSVFEYLRNKY